METKLMRPATFKAGATHYRPSRLDHFPSGRGLTRCGNGQFLKRHSCGKTEIKPKSQANNLINWLEEHKLPVHSDAKSLHKNVATMERATGDHRS